jgi:hypothetical protein
MEEGEEEVKEIKSNKMKKSELKGNDQSSYARKCSY